MGILEFHFHDSTFEFAPSKTVGDGSEADAETETPTPAAPGVATDESGERAGVPASAKKGAGVVIALAVLVGLGALGKKLVEHRRGTEEPAGEDEAPSAAGESIEITDD